MTRIKRWTAAFASRIDRLASQVENHEALVESAIHEVNRAAARAKVQLARVRQDGSRLRNRLAELQQAEAMWRDRARRSASDDEGVALECLHRSRAARRQAADIERRIAEHEEAERQLAGDVATVEQRLSSLTEQRNVMRTRQSRAEALSAIRSATSSCADEVGELFYRWEMRVTEAELAGSCVAAHDPLEASFASDEEKAELRAELAELMSAE